MKPRRIIMHCSRIRGLMYGAPAFQSRIRPHTSVYPAPRVGAFRIGLRPLLALHDVRSDGVGVASDA